LIVKDDSGLQEVQKCARFTLAPIDWSVAGQAKAARHMSLEYSDHLTAQSATRASGFVANYRQRLAALIPALTLAYSLIVWPLLYAKLPSDMGTSYPLNKIVIPLLAVVAIALWLAERPRIDWVHQKMILFGGAFWLFSGFSLMWSPVPEHAVGAFGLLSMMYVALFLSCLTAPSFESVIRPVFWVFAVTIFLNAAFVVLTPPGPIGHEGIYPQKNSLGAVAALGVLVGLSRLRSPYRLEVLAGLAMIVLGLFELVESQSKTSLGFAIGAPMLAASMIVLQRVFRISLPVQAVVLATGGVALFWFANATGMFTIGDVSMIVSGEPTFTRRTDLWGFAATQIPNHFWLGHGFESFWNLGPNTPASTGPSIWVREAPTGHNAYVDLLIGGGVVGFGLFVAFLVAVWGQIARVLRVNPAAGWFLASILTFMLLQALLESPWFSAPAPTAALLVLLAFLPLSIKNWSEPEG
jgi:hypothetical protein